MKLASTQSRNHNKKITKLPCYKYLCPVMQVRVACAAQTAHFRGPAPAFCPPQTQGYALLYFLHQPVGAREKRRYGHSFVFVLSLFFKLHTSARFAAYLQRVPIAHTRGYLSPEMQLSTGLFVDQGFPSDPKEVHKLLHPQTEESQTEE